MFYKNIQEEELKNRVDQDYFSDFDCTRMVGNIDFCVMPKKDHNQIELFKEQSVLWAEAKRGLNDPIDMFVQLIITIGKERWFNTILPPTFLSVFDAERTLFIPYQSVQDLFYQNDFNWNVVPSNHKTKEFEQIKTLITELINSQQHIYYFGKDDKEFRFFIKKNNKNGVKYKFSPEAQAVLDAGGELWIYDLSHWCVEINALFYDIGESFQGCNEKGKINNFSKDIKYNELTEQLEILTFKIQPKVYEYEFLKN